MTDFEKAVAYTLVDLAKNRRLLFQTEDDDLLRVHVFDEDDPDQSRWSEGRDETEMFSPVHFADMLPIEKEMIIDGLARAVGLDLPTVAE